MQLFRAVGASLFDLAPRRVWLISLRRLPQGLPFPAKRSLPRTFFLFHCSSPFGGGPLAPALPCGVRTFLPCPFEGARAIACSSSQKRTRLPVLTPAFKTGPDSVKKIRNFNMIQRGSIFLDSRLRPFIRPDFCPKRVLDHST